MRFKGLDLNHLLTLEVLLVERHLTRASKRLRLTQPAISNALTKLRHHFDDPLLIRHGREMGLTPFAVSILKPLQETLQHIQEIAAARPFFEASTAVRLYKIVVSDYISVVLMGALMLRLRKLAPHVKVEQLCINDDGVAKFSRGDADAVIRPEESWSLPEFPQRVLFEENFVCIASAHNRSVGYSLSAEEYYAQPRVVPLSKRYFPDMFLRGQVHVGDCMPMPFPSIPLFVANTDHIAIVPERLVEIFEHVLPLRRIKLTTPLPRAKFVIQWHASTITDPFSSWIHDQIQIVAELREFDESMRPACATALASAALPAFAGSRVESLQELKRNSSVAF